MSVEKEQIFIIGGGASGLVAAIFAKNDFNEVFILEKNTKVGKKILLSGNGRCNFSNLNCLVRGYNNQLFVNEIFKEFDLNATLDFFKNIGLLFYHDDEGRFYPISNHSSSVYDCLIEKCKKLKIDILTSKTVEKIISDKNKFNIFCENEIFKADKVIVCTGGFPLNSVLGHSSSKFNKGLTGLKCKESIVKQLSGIRIACMAKLYDDHMNMTHEETGEVIFKDEGISGIVIMNISSIINWKNIRTPIIKLDLLPTMRTEELKLFFYNKIKNGIVFDKLLVGVFQNALSNYLIKKSQKDICNNLLNTINEQDENFFSHSIDALINNIKNFQLNINGEYENNQVTNGGILVNEVDYNLQSKICKNLFLCGEILDVDGLCGGFNLQWAWSSGAIAGASARGDSFETFKN